MNIEQASRCGRFVGRKELIRHLEGKCLTLGQSSKAKCFECMCGYSDGAQDCRIPDCPLYGRMPYRDRKAQPCPQNPLKPIHTATDGVETGETEGQTT